MKHAGEATLDAIEPLLAELRELQPPREPRRGVFYRNSTAFVHFHEDPAGIFADLRDASDWLRMPVNTAAERRRFLALAARILAGNGSVAKKSAAPGIKNTGRPVATRSGRRSQ
jgi:hypothetical protein